MTQEFIRKVTKAIALVIFVTGAFGSMLVFPFALTNSVTLIAVSGIYFVAGAMMMTGGLGTYAVLMKDEK